MRSQKISRTIFSMFIFVLVFSFGLTGNGVAGEIGGVDSVNAVVIDEQPYIQPSVTVPPADEGETIHSSRFPAQPDTYIPMPIPLHKEPVSKAEPPSVEVIKRQNRMISYNLITGEEIIYEPALDQDLPATDFITGDEGGRPSPQDKTGEDQRWPLNFSDLSLISNPEDYPWRVNVKMFFTQGGVNFVCSGVLIDPLHVITAGHCVHQGSGGNWSTNVVVVPGYENVVRPYGDAAGVQLHSWAGWTQDGNFDHDIGIIDLDRPIGALTGWHGYGFNDSCSFYTGNTFHNPGYPATSPYNGQYMYYWSGTFDGCETIWPFDAWWYGNEISFNKLSYGGQSGSGAYYIDSANNRYVYAVLSNGTSTTTWDVRITSGKFYDIRDNIIAGDTPPTLDLIPLDVTTSPGTINAGNQLSSMSYLVHNYSSVSGIGTVNVGVYLSTNDNISTADTLIQSHSFYYNSGPKSTVTVNVSPPPTIPASTAGGNYYIGVILNLSDYNTGNNESDGQDASPILVVSGPDLIIQSLTTSPATPAPGQNVNVTVTVKNQGAGAAGGFYIDIYKNRATAPPNPGPGGDAWCWVSSLAAGATYTCNLIVSYATAGTYNMWALADTFNAVSESNENNNVYGPKTINVVQTYTLTVSKAGTGSGTVTSSPAGINCGTDCTENYTSGTVVTLTATPATGSVFAGWSGACTGSGTCTVTMNASKSVTATFNLVQYTLTVTKAGTGSGTVTSSPAGINCGTDCTENYTSDTVVTLTATPATGSVFAGWSGACTGSGTCTVTMNANKSVTATFNTTLPPVSVTLVPDSTSIPRGGTLGYTVTVTNNTTYTQTFQYWTYVILPNGTRYPPTGQLFGPVTVTLSPGQVRSAHLTHGIPATAPLGTYTYYGNIGPYPTVWDSDSFTFTVTSTLSPGTRKGWELLENGLTK